MSGSTRAVDLAIKLWAIYAVWLGVLKIVEETGLDKKIAKLMRPISRFLMSKQSAETENQIAINLTSNLLGMGNASTPSGIKAIEGMYTSGQIATSGMLMFMILNTANLQIIPTTIIGLRTLAGSANPNDVMLPIIIASSASLLTGIILIKLCSKIFKDKSNDEYTSLLGGVSKHKKSKGKQGKLKPVETSTLNKGKINSSNMAIKHKSGNQNNNISHKKAGVR